MYFGKRQSSLCKLTLNGQGVEWAEKWPYLGIILQTGQTFNCCITEKIRKFYRACNGIFRIEGRSNDLMVLKLVESHCIPILTYGIEVIFVANSDTRRQLRVAYNSVFRRICRYRPWQSVRELQAFLKRPNWEVLVEKRCDNFHRRIRGDDVLSSVFPI